MKPSRGVNLGGWLVLERWIMPSVFAGTDAADEYTLCQSLGKSEVTKRLRRHRKTFITERHIRQVAELGLDVVRLPVGYWLFGGEEPYANGSEEYVDKLFGWAKEQGLQVILDVHAAPGSQNGWDHSGRAGLVGWPSEANVTATLDFLERLVVKWGHEPTLIGVEVLNEPHWDVPLGTLVDYYREAHGIIRGHCPPVVRTIVSDAFRPEQMSKALRKTRLDVTLDVHFYQLFTPEDRALDLDGHLRKASKEWPRLLGKLTKHHPVLVGEWSAAMSELYGPTGERQRTYHPADYVSYFRAQREAFESAGASWTYWTARTETAGPWSLLDNPGYLDAG